MLFVYIFLGLIVLLLLIAAFLPKAYHIEKTIVIDKSVPEVMPKIGDLNNYAIWNPWQQSEPTSSRTIKGEPMKTGHSYAWLGKKIGEGSLTVNNIDARHINFDLQFIKPWKATAKDNWLFEPWGEGGTKITWENNGALPWPIARLMGPLLNKNLSIQFEQGLKNLKTLCEKQ